MSYSSKHSLPSQILATPAHSPQTISLYSLPLVFMVQPLVRLANNTPSAIKKASVSPPPPRFEPSPPSRCSAPSNSSSESEGRMRRWRRSGARHGLCCRRRHLSRSPRVRGVDRVQSRDHRQPRDFSGDKEGPSDDVRRSHALMTPMTGRCHGLGGVPMMPRCRAPARCGPSISPPMMSRCLLALFSS